ncbi:hypothetical protein [Rikenella microfusus]|uniref:DUF4190 domain-containing protein n=1 Tax=Rikenella microfusus TaxID=28139 RepID=A0A379MTW7_9BACT|nr:hypothetical protein [Rikenella microfusus]SUE35051.1 Uncharacterised protein [Rikenella microfusus]HJE87668.1 hypothetical protein [Rikenella microfusus]
MENQTQNTPPQQPYQQTVIIQQVEKRSNGIGTAGFILALVTLFLGWIPVFGWILWVLGLIFSAVGVTKRPKGLAIAGLVISLIGIVFLLALFGVILGAAGIAATTL